MGHAKIVDVLAVAGLGRASEDPAGDAFDGGYFLTPVSVATPSPAMRV
jgi:hypothetical protein